MGKTARFKFPYPEDGDPPNGPDQIKALAEAIEAALIPSGTIFATAATEAPSGYFLCDGSAVSRTTYADLFAVCKTSFGNGDGVKTFNLPDLRGRVPVGVDGAANRLTANDAMGKSGGEEKHVLTVGELAKHEHEVTDNEGFTPSVHNVTPADGGLGHYFRWAGKSILKAVGVGKDEAHNNMQPFQVVNYLIKI